MIIFGLGNPGLRYRLTRHNAGSLFIERFAKKQKKRFRTCRGYRKATLKIEKSSILLIKPTCYMNTSGVAVRKISSYYNRPFLVVIDDINLPLGRIRLRERGSDGGHRGLRSIIEELDHSDFPRLRVGIGRSHEDPVDHVLKRFKRQEKKVLNKVFDEGISGLFILIKEGMADAQNKINSVDLTENE